MNGIKGHSSGMPDRWRLKAILKAILFQRYWLNEYAVLAPGAVTKYCKWYGRGGKGKLAAEMRKLFAPSTVPSS